MQDLPELHYDKLKAHFLKTIPLPEGLFEQIKPCFSIRLLKKKEYLLRQMQVSRYESYIVSGLLQTSVIDDTGREHVLYFPHEDWWTGDYKSFTTGNGATMEIQALEDCILLQISRDDLETLYHRFPVFERFFRILNGNAAIALQERVVEGFSQNADEKYSVFLEQYPALHNRLSQKRIAGFLGVTPEYFSQMTKRLSPKS